MLNELQSLRQLVVNNGGSNAEKLNELECLQAWARAKGVGSTGTKNELECLRALVVANGGSNAETLNEAGCLHKLCFLAGCVPTEGLSEGQMLAILVNPSSFFLNHSPAIQSMTNAQKLSLPANTALGTRVQVTDGFVVSGAGSPEVLGFYYPSGTTNGRPSYANPINPSHRYVAWADFGEGLGWNIVDDQGGAQYFSAEDAGFPYLVVTWSDAGGAGAPPLPTLTHPAVQELAAPSTAQGGVFVSGGTIDGVFTRRTDLDVAGETETVFQLLGVDDINTIAAFNRVIDNGAFSSWSVYDQAGVALYYSLSDVATPDLASNWKNASDDTPASITVTSVTVGEIAAGLVVSNDGVTNGSSYVSQPFQGRQYYMGLSGGGSNNMHWDRSAWTDDVGAWTTSNVAFPWQGTDAHTGHNGATFARNNVASEANWQTL